MRVVITGANGFLGGRLADALLAGSGGSDGDALPVTELVLTDVCAPPPRADPRARCLPLDLAAPGAAARLLAPRCDLLFHLAAVVSGHAEEDFDLGYSVNLDATRALLEAARRQAAAQAGGVPVRVVFASSVAVFGAGGELPAAARVDDRTAPAPQTSYGTAKAMCELLVSDYSRRGFVDGRALRLPTVTVRAGAANLAVTSFASGVVREPLGGRAATCPVPPEVELWVSSPRAAVRNLARCAALPAAALGARRVLAAPGLRVRVADVLAALRRVAGPAAAARVRMQPDDAITRIVRSLPVDIDNTRALSLGFVVDRDFEDIIRAYIEDDLKGNYYDKV